MSLTPRDNGSGIKCWKKLPADLLEDVISADVLDVLVDDGPGALVFGQLPLQPRHHLFVVVPQVGLRSRRWLVLMELLSQLRLFQ